MFDYIKGSLAELSPAEAVVECGGIGFDIQISLQTFQALQGKENVTVYLYHYLREDDEQFYGFATRDERELFKLLISVSGIGVGTARMMLSSLTDEEIRQAILAEDVARIKSVKGIGLKSAQRVIIDLKDKIVKGGGTDSSLPILGGNDDALVQEATTALVMLGFTKPNINKVLPAILKKNPSIRIEELIKEALKKL
jgi:Holliday junction DNA helicase RuvA